MLVSFMLLNTYSYSVNAKGKWILHLDDNKRVITGCMKVPPSAIAALWISMKCQSSFIESIQLCTQGRILQEFNSKDECSKASKFHDGKYGVYMLKTDHVENVYKKKWLSSRICG